MQSRAGAAAAVLALGLVAAPPLGAQTEDGPRLVVTLVVDQLRPDLLERYGYAFKGGLRRLLDEGFSFTQASHAHARTSTAPGHATIATGVFPSRHAVVANAWAQRTDAGWESMYAVADAESPIVGYEQVEALEGRSPKNMIRDGLADWLHAANDDARIVSISKKDRAAVPLGGHGATEHVYWMVPELGQFVTSRYYRDDYPRWLERFNREVMPPISAQNVWHTEVPEDLRPLARPDSAWYEGDRVHVTFPHASDRENPPGDVQAHNAWAYDQSRADAAVILLALTAIDELDLGQRDDLDMLQISLSATDRVGHYYGPLSQEQFSNLIHLDRVVGQLLDHLDETVGEGRWVLGFTADHGVATMPEAMVELGLDTGAVRVTAAESNGALGGALRDGAPGTDQSPEAVAERVKKLVEERGLVAKAYTHHELTRGVPADSFSVLFRNSHYPGRAWGPLSRWGVEVRFGENDLYGIDSGTNHESTYWYDRWVPMIFLGPGVTAGATETMAYTVDFAPTLAGLAGIPVPHDLDGRRIY
jgi:hypothetical protein